MNLVAVIAALIVLVLVLRALARRGESASLGSVPPTEDSVRELLLRGRKIEAIKAYRTLHRVDLKTAKEAVERLAEEPSP